MREAGNLSVGFLLLDTGFRAGRNHGQPKSIRNLQLWQPTRP